MQNITEFLDWIARGTGVIFILISALGFMFREKWKQVLQRSLSADMERLKAELARENAEHAAGLNPKLEQIKHDLQQKLETYKVGLIEQAETAKGRSELRKSIALRFSEIEFERLTALELLLAPIGTEIVGFAGIPPKYKKTEHVLQALEKLSAFRSAAQQAEMFLEFEDIGLLGEYRRTLSMYVREFVGEGKPEPEDCEPLHEKLISQAAESQTRLIAKIKSLAAFPKIHQ